MTISRKIAFLVGAALAVCGLLFLFALTGLSGGEAGIGRLAGKAAADGLGPDLKAIQESLASARNVLVVVLLLGGGLVGTLGYFVWRALVKPLKAVENAITEVAERLDFTASVPVVADDEIGHVLQAYNRLLSRVRDSFLEIQNDVANILEVTEEVDQSSRKIARNSQVQSDASANMASAVEQMTVSITAVAHQANDASRHTDKSREIAVQSAGIILDTVTGIQQISDSVREAATRIKALRVDCDSISSMAKIIREIADQTNLLALNAAIEAARAGEQGRGFAVVADEVRKLAERTRLATQEISGLLNSMQESARLAVESMGHTEIAVDSGVVNAREAGDSIEKLKTGADAAATVVADISGAMREQETASSAIAHNIEQIAQMSEQNSSAASASAAGVGRLTQVGLAMAQTLAAYKVETGEKKIVLRLADTHPEGHPAIRAVQAMAEIIDQRSSGRITLKVIPGGVFGSEKDELEQLRNGTLDMTRASCAAFNKGCPATVIPALPFVFKSTEHQQRALDGAPGQEILASLAASDYIGLAFFDCGARNIYANKPIHSLAEVRDLKLRVMQSDLWMGVAKAMGAVATPMAMEDIFTGFKTGLVEASEGNIPTFFDYKHHEAAKYFCLTEHAMVPELVVFSKKRWDTLAPGDQALIAEAARESVVAMRRFWREREEAARSGALAAGTVFVKDVDKASFQNAMRPVYDKFVTSPQQKALFQAIKAMS
jgi:tripartite ATP-independent transporter DctP family solute receptor